jgi:hypothetical protein
VDSVKLSSHAGERPENPPIGASPFFVHSLVPRMFGSQRLLCVVRFSYPRTEMDNHGVGRSRGELPLDVLVKGAFSPMALYSATGFVAAP